jgi:flagellar motility protein MotE (MotC chaperone)
MKKLWNILVLALAVNFVALLAGVGYLYQSKRLDRERVRAIRELLFPPQADAAGGPATTQPSGGAARATTQPVLKLEELLAAHTGRPAAEQAQVLQRTFDSRMAQLDARQGEIEHLHVLVRNAQSKLTEERELFEGQRAALEAREQGATRLAADKGFQDSLKLYGTMRPKQVKDVFATLADDVVVRYLRAMEPRDASKIIKEFKSPAELERLKLLMERVRSAEAAASAKD